MSNYVVVIPIFNHEASIDAIVNYIVSYSLPCIIVNDGSDDHCRQVIKQIEKKYPDHVCLVEHMQNKGKGAAVTTGIRYASQKSFKYVVQVDADGQHDLKDISRLIELSQQNPAALITGVPIYDQSVPRIRFYLRYLTHVWVWINTLSFTIKDSMCGFRIYPVDTVLPILDRYDFLPRMSFDVEVLVRSYWEKIPIVNMPTYVHYPINGVSHFKLWLDNWHITLTHAKLFLEMCKRVAKIRVFHS